MRSFRAFVLAIVATLALLGGLASTASADEGSGRWAHQPITTSATDPGDPGLPPD
jgi:hypothetical protein